MKKYSFFECLAHQGDLLTDHLMAVTKGVDRLWGGDRSLPAQAALLSALVHDLGKANFWFQERLQHKKGEKSALSNHSFVSAVIGWLLSKDVKGGDEQSGQQFRLSAFTSVLKHHGNLRDPWADTYMNARGELREDSGPGSVFHRQVESMDMEGIANWLWSVLPDFGLKVNVPDLSEDAMRCAIEEVSRFRIRKAFPENEEKVGSGELEDALRFLMGFGSLLQMDKIHTATGLSEFTRRDLSSGLVYSYLEDLRRTRPPSSLDPIRDAVRETMLQEWAAHSDERLFTLTAPTGSGKTLAALHAALNLRKALSESSGETPRIIYCLPFTAIIDQNYDVYWQVLKLGGYEETSDLILKHHHLTDLDYKSPDPEFDPDGAELFVETWQSELVVTTFHQLLHTIFTGRNRNLKRLPTLRRAIVIMDEVQAIPPKYWGPIRRAMEGIARCLDTHFILMTATKPLIFLPDMSCELLPDHRRYYQSLSRVRLVHRAQADTPLHQFVSEVVQEVQSTPQLSRMIVVNYRRLVRHLTEAFEEVLDNEDFPIYPLSALLTPLDRKRRIEEIRASLEQGQPGMVVTTQLIEAGVDLSVDCVERDMAPLDAIIQAAGRCNRHGAGPGGIVRVWSLIDDEPKRRFTSIYDPALIDTTRKVLNEYGDVEEARFLDMGESYFREMYDRVKAVEEPVDKLLACGQFEFVEDRFQLIKEPPRQSLFIIQNEQDEAIWQQYREVQGMENPIERKKNFLRLRKNLMERVIEVFTKDRVDELCPLDARQGGYDPRFGYIAEESPGASGAMIL